jgi:hypothetical protein
MDLIQYQYLFNRFFLQIIYLYCLKLSRGFSLDRITLCSITSLHVFGLLYGLYHHFHKCFCYIVTTNLIEGGGDLASYNKLTGETLGAWVGAWRSVKPQGHG